MHCRNEREQDISYIVDTDTKVIIAILPSAPTNVRFCLPFSWTRDALELLAQLS